MGIYWDIGILMGFECVNNNGHPEMGSNNGGALKDRQPFPALWGFPKIGGQNLGGWVKTYLLSYLGESSSTNQLFGI